MNEGQPRRDDYPDTPEGRHMWAQAVQAWNNLTGVRSEDLVKQWNEERKSRG